MSSSNTDICLDYYFNVRKSIRQLKTVDEDLEWTEEQKKCLAFETNIPHDNTQPRYIYDMSDILKICNYEWDKGYIMMSRLLMIKQTLRTPILRFDLGIYDEEDYKEFCSRSAFENTAIHPKLDDFYITKKNASKRGRLLYYSYCILSYCYKGKSNLLKKSQKKIESLKRSKKRTEDFCSENEERLKEAKKELGEYKEKYELMATKNKTLTTEKDELSAKLIISERKNSENEEIINELKNTISTLTEEKSEMEETFKQQIKDLEDKLVESNREKEAKQEMFDSLEYQYDELNEKYQEIHRKWFHDKSKDDLKKTIATLELEKNELQKEVFEMSSKNEEFNNENMVMSKTIADLKEEIIRIQSENEKQKTELLASSNRCRDEYEKKIKSLNDDIAEYKENKKAMSRKYQEQYNELYKIREEVENYKQWKNKFIKMTNLTKMRLLKRNKPDTK